MYQTNSFGCVVKSCCNGGGNVNQIEVIFPNPLNVNIDIPTDFNINFSATGSVDLNLPPITVNVNVEEITGQIQQLVSGSIEEIVSGTINQLVDGDVGVNIDGGLDVNVDGEVGVAIDGDVELTGNVGLDGNVNVTGDVLVEASGCIGIKECDKEDTCTTLIDIPNVIFIEIVEDEKLHIINRQNMKINLIVSLTGTKANGNEDIVVMNINLNSNEDTIKNIDDSIKDICISKYIINDYLATLIPR